MKHQKESNAIYNQDNFHRLVILLKCFCNALIVTLTILCQESQSLKSIFPAFSLCYSTTANILTVVQLFKEGNARHIWIRYMQTYRHRITILSLHLKKIENMVKSRHNECQSICNIYPRNSEHIIIFALFPLQLNDIGSSYKTHDAISTAA